MFVIIMNLFSIFITNAQNEIWKQPVLIPYEPFFQGHIAPLIIIIRKDFPYIKQYPTTNE